MAHASCAAQQVAASRIIQQPTVRMPLDEIQAPQQAPQARQQNTQNRYVTLSSIVPDNNCRMILATFKINKRNVMCMIDTGSPINLISSTVVNSLPHRGTIEPCDIVAYAANSSPISLFGKVQLEFDVNDTVHSLTFYIVEEVTKGVLLALNWLVETEAILDLKNSVMKGAHGAEIPLELRHFENTHVRKVSLPEDVIIPPHHELITPGAIQTPFPTEGLLEPTNDIAAKGVLIARHLVSPVMIRYLYR